MMTELSRDSLDSDDSTLIFEPRGGTVRIHGQRVPHLLNRRGIRQRQWDHLERCWMVPLREMPGLIQLAEADHRMVIIEDHLDLDPPHSAGVA